MVAAAVVAAMLVVVGVFLVEVRSVGVGAVAVKKKKQYIIYMGEKQVLTRGALLLKKLTTNYLTTQ